MKRIKTSLLLVWVAMLFAGCATRLLEQDYFNRLGRVELGMSQTEFKQIFPESIPRKAKQYPQGAVEVLEVTYKTYSFFPSENRHRDMWTGMEDQLQWFYFYNGKLLKNGKPEDWPTEADLSSEERIR